MSRKNKAVTEKCKTGWKTLKHDNEKMLRNKDTDEKECSEKHMNVETRRNNSDLYGYKR